MMKGTIIKRKCLTCNKPADVVSEFKMDTFIMYTLTCGHSLVDSAVGKKEESEIEAYISADHKKLFPYQVKGVEFVFNSNARCLLADEMGLGKTAQSLVPLALNEDLLPAIAIVKSVAKINWSKESIRFGKVIPQVIGKGKEVCHDLFKFHIFSYDMLTAMMNSKKARKDFDAIRKRCKTVIIDETHLIKNPETARARAVKEFVMGGEYVDGREFPAIPHVIGLSGTPMKNNASELFTILNILHPEKYFRHKDFCMRHVQYVWDGYRYKFGGLKYPDEFKEMTQDYIIRRTMDEVFPELPKLWRKPIFAEISDEANEIYDKEEQEFAEYFDEGKDDVDYQANILARMARLRHITSLAKIDTTIDKTVEFLGSCERKLIIFVHHHDTRDILAERLDPVLQELELGKCWVLTSKDNAEVQQKINEFEQSRDRVIILSTLSHGESLNLQFMSDSILHERQWNPANEDQAISGRVRRIGQTAKQLNCYIPIAIGTIDEYFAELVEQKREYFESSMSGKEVESWDSSSLIMELAEILASRGRAKWKIA